MNTQQAPKGGWDGKERRVAQRRNNERRQYGRLLTSAEQAKLEAMLAESDRRGGDRRVILDRRRSEIEKARGR